MNEIVLNDNRNNDYHYKNTEKSPCLCIDLLIIFMELTNISFLNVSIKFI